MNDEAIVFIDYDNIEKLDRIDNQSLENAIYSYIINKKLYKRIVLRFYGGWFYYLKQSYAAMNLIPWIHSYPHIIGTTILDGELVRSLSFENHDLPYTFRIRSKHLSIQIDQNKICRYDNSCDLFVLNKILKNKKCSDLKCRVSHDDIFLQSEQKLVDSMICIDLIHMSSLDKYDLYLLSSDDDIIPAIRYVSYIGKKVHIIHTKHNPYSYKTEYKQPYTANISEGCIL
jgi:hypothetical protein